MAQTKSRLGRGLDSLISGGVAAKPATQSGKATKASAAAVATTSPVGITELPIGKIEPNPHQPRREFDPEALRELADSIRAEGLLQPVVVRPVGKDKHQLIAGERRWRACQQIGMRTIPVRVLEVSEASSAVLSLIENLQRADLNPIEESLGYASLMRDFDLTQEAVAERVGKARASIANALRLLQLDRELQSYLAKGILSVGHAKVLLGLESNAQRLLLARQIIERGLSVRQTEELVGGHKKAATAKGGSKANNSGAEDQTIKAIERQIAAKLNTRVLVRHGGKKGRVVIEYYGNDDLQRIIEKLGISG